MALDGHAKRKLLSLLEGFNIFPEQSTTLNALLRIEKIQIGLVPRDSSVNRLLLKLCQSITN